MYSKGFLEEKITLSEQAKVELNWWTHNLNLHNWKYLTTPSPQLTINSDVSSQGWRIGEHRVKRNGRGTLVKGREEIPHECARTGGSQIGNNDVHDATLKWDFHSFTVRQRNQQLSYVSKKRGLEGEKSKTLFQSEITSCLAKLPLQQNTSQG